MLALPQMLGAAEKKSKKAAQPAPAAVSAVTDINLLDHWKSGEEQLKKGRTDDALKSFLAVHSFCRDNLLLIKCVREAYEKALGDGNLKQSQREDLYLKQQRISSLTARYQRFKGESAYNIGFAYKKRGDAEQARKYLIEACQTVPFSLDPASTWMKSKNLLLAISGLEGEF
jgi:tetratricopeptide (TPR) repeat protein